MKKRLLCMLIALVITISVVPSASAASMGNFNKYQTYSNQFKDISSGDWYYNYVRDMYRYGLVNGRTANRFEPDGQMTIVEVIVLAARIHHTYNDYEPLQPGGVNWYADYVEYARSYDITGYSPTSADIHLPATREQAAGILAKCVPESELTAINTLNPKIPNNNGTGDVVECDYYYEIRSLYAAGVLTGSDSNFSFNGDDNVKRSEVMGLACRIIDKSQRVSFNMPTKTALEALTGGYWRNYGATNGTGGVYRFNSNGTYDAYIGWAGDHKTGTYTLSNGVLNISGYGISNMRYNNTYNVFGYGIPIEIQGMMLTRNALSPTSKANFDEYLSNYYKHGSEI